MQNGLTKVTVNCELISRKVASYETIHRNDAIEIEPCVSQFFYSQINYVRVSTFRDNI